MTCAPAPINQYDAAEDGLIELSRLIRWKQALIAGAGMTPADAHTMAMAADADVRAGQAKMEIAA